MPLIIYLEKVPRSGTCRCRQSVVVLENLSHMYMGVAVSPNKICASKRAVCAIARLCICVFQEWVIPEYTDAQNPRAVDTGLCQKYTDLYSRGGPTVQICAVQNGIREIKNVENCQRSETSKRVERNISTSHENQKQNLRGTKKFFYENFD